MTSDSSADCRQYASTNCWTRVRQLVGIAWRASERASVRSNNQFTPYARCERHDWYVVARDTSDRDCTRVRTREWLSFVPFPFFFFSPFFMIQKTRRENGGVERCRGIDSMNHLSAGAHLGEFWWIYPVLLPSYFPFSSLLFFFYGLVIIWIQLTLPTISTHRASRKYFEDISWVSYLYDNANLQLLCHSGTECQLI